jgi:hypothetical protein
MFERSLVRHAYFLELHAANHGIEHGKPKQLSSLRKAARILWLRRFTSSNRRSLTWVVRIVRPWAGGNA